MKTRFIGTWFISEMESWDADFINLVVPGNVTVNAKGSGSMQFGAVEADLDWSVQGTGSKQRLQFAFQGFDEGDQISGRGWATISGSEMNGRIRFDDGDESGFTAVREKEHRASTRPLAKVIRLPKRNFPSSQHLQARVYSAEVLFKQQKPPLTQFARDLNIVPERAPEIEEDSWGARGSLEIWFQAIHGRKVILHIQRAHFKRKETYIRDLQSLLEDVKCLAYVEQVQINRH